MADIFLSYSRDDTSLARELVRLLEHEGWTIFWDRDLPAGREYPPLLEDELESARCVVVIWSPRSVASAWVRAEAQRGLDRMVLLPVEVRGARPPLPFSSLQGIQLGDWPSRRNDLEVQRLLAGVRRLLDEDQTADLSVVRDDPTLSTRVAQRVMTALEHDRREQAGKALRLERALNGLLVRVLAGSLTGVGLQQVLVDVVQAETGFRGVWLVREDGTVVTASGSDIELTGAVGLPPEGFLSDLDSNNRCWWLAVSSNPCGAKLVAAGNPPLDRDLRTRLEGLADLLGQLLER